MKITRVRAKNLMLLDDVDVAPGKITGVSGPNGSGKTSFLNAILAPFGKSYDPTLVKRGKTQAEVALDFDTGETATLTIDTEKEKRSVSVRDADGKKLGAGFLSQLVDAQALNPLRLLTASAKERVNTLIETVPVAVSAEEITKATGFRYTPTGEEKNGFDLLERLRKTFYAERTGINAQADAKKKAAEEREADFPAEEYVSADPKALRTEREALVRERDTHKKTAETIRLETERKIDAGSSKKRRELETAFGEEIERIKADAQAKIDAARAKLESDVDQVTKKAENYRKDAETKERSEHARLDESYRAALDTLAERIGKAEEQAKVADRAQHAREDAARYRKEHEELAKQSEARTVAILGIDALKAELIKRVPIAGLDIHDGDIYLNDVPFDRVNEEARIGFCFDVAELRLRELPVICIDGVEALDSAHLAAFEKRAAKSRAQLFIGRATDECADCGHGKRDHEDGPCKWGDCKWHSSSGLRIDAQ